MSMIDFADRGMWLQARRQVVTATDVGRIVGVSKWGGRLDVYNEKMGIDPDENDNMVIGRALQTGIANAYHVLRGKREANAHLEIEHAPQWALHMGPQPGHAASLDCWQRTIDHEWHPLEVKNTSGYPAEPYDEWLTQVQWQMHCTDTNRATIVALMGGDEIQWWDVERDEDVVQPLIVAADSFMAQFVKLAQPPPPDGPRDARAVRRLYAVADVGTEVTLGMDDLDTALHLEATKEQLKALEETKDSLTARLQARMGAAEVAYLPNGLRLTWKNQERAGYFVKPSTSRVFRMEKPRK
jgi:predicted phage-related endonuclease